MSDSFCMAQAGLNQSAASAEVLSFMTAAASINPRDTEGSLRAISASAIGAVVQVRAWQEKSQLLDPAAPPFLKHALGSAYKVNQPQGH